MTIFSEEMLHVNRYNCTSDHTCCPGCRSDLPLLVVQIFVIDKKMLPLKESGLPQFVIDQTPKLMRRSKMPIVKARVQGKIMTLVADQKVFPVIPVGKSVKATLSGIYIMDVKAIRGKLETPPPKKKWYQKLMPGKKN